MSRRRHNRFTCRHPNCTSFFYVEMRRDEHERLPHQRCTCGWCGVSFAGHAGQLKRHTVNPSFHERRGDAPPLGTFDPADDLSNRPTWVLLQEIAGRASVYESGVMANGGTFHFARFNPEDIGL